MASCQYRLNVLFFNKIESFLVYVRARRQGKLSLSNFNLRARHVDSNHFTFELTE